MIEIKTTEELKEMEKLRLKYAFNTNNPIMNPSQMLDDIEVVVSCVDEEDEEMVNEHKRDAILSGVNPAFIDKLEEKLCSFDGELLCFDRDDYAGLILEHGQLWYGQPIYFEEMEMGECHANSIEINNEHPEYPIVVGFGLSNYGYWFNHTWILVPNEDEQKNLVLETTYPCQLYFGVVLTKSQLIDFKNSYRRR